MKAAVFTGIGNIVVKDVEKPVCEDENILLKVAACALCGTDVRTFRHGKSNVKPPQILGHEVAGTIEEVGENVKNFSVGERVTIAAIAACGACSWCARGMQNLCENFTAIGYEYAGGFCEYMLVPARMIKDGSVNRIADKLTFDEAALAEPFACAINGQELSNVSLGDTVVIIGAGPIGCMHIELAKARGAANVIVVDISPERLEMAKKFGADMYARENGVDAVLKCTDGRGADVIIVAASSAKAQEDALRMAAPRGRVNLFGGLPKDNPYIQLDSNIVHYKELFIHGTSGSLARHNKMALDLFTSGRVSAKKFITHTLKLDEIVRGIELMETKKALKVIIHPGGRE